MLAGGFIGFGGMFFGLVLGDSTVVRKVEAANPEMIHSRIQENMKIDAAGNVLFQVRLSGWFAARFRSFIKRSGSALKNEAESLLDTLVPGADLKSFQFQGRNSSYEYRAKLPLRGILPQLAVNPDIVRPFMPASIARPIRLYDGHQVSYSRRVTVEGRSFEPFSWQVRRERFFAEMKVQGNQIDYAFGLFRVRDNQLAPLHYREIRSALNQLRLRLNTIREKKRSADQLRSDLQQSSQLEHDEGRQISQHQQ